MRPVSRTDWINKEIKLISDLFVDHTLQGGITWPDRWSLRKPNTSDFWCEIITAHKSHLIVVGDFDPCVFAYYSPSRVSFSSKELVYWIADTSIDYCIEKANSGMGGSTTVSYLTAVAIHDLKEALKDATECYEDDIDAHQLGVYEETVADAITDLNNGHDVETVQNNVYSELSAIEPDSYEWIRSVGEVPSRRVLIAIVAIRRLAELFRSEGKK